MSSSSSPAPGTLSSDSLSASVVADLNAAAAAVAAAAAEQHQQHQQLLQSVVSGENTIGAVSVGGNGGGTRKKGKDALNEEAQALKTRTENRERKKRWREQNEDRSKCSLDACLLGEVWYLVRFVGLFPKVDYKSQASWMCVCVGGLTLSTQERVRENKRDEEREERLRIGEDKERARVIPHHPLVASALHPFPCLEKGNQRLIHSSCFF